MGFKGIPEWRQFSMAEDVVHAGYHEHRLVPQIAGGRKVVERGHGEDGTVSPKSWRGPAPFLRDLASLDFAERLAIFKR